MCLSSLECPANYSSSFDAVGYPRVPMASLWPNRGNKAKLYVISSALLSFLPYYCHSFQIMVLPSELLPFHIFFSLNSSGTFPYPKGEKNGHRRPWPYMRVIIEYIKFWMQSTKKKNRNGQISHLKEALFVWAFA